ncbi:MAG: hypothetical protein HS126_25040 [Anaerolineales bacterium]|nr:hypothetical protein [Anaerolineales bacterium]
MPGQSRHAQSANDCLYACSRLEHTKCRDAGAITGGTYWLAYLAQSNNLHFRVALTGSARGLQLLVQSNADDIFKLTDECLSALVAVRCFVEWHSLSKYADYVETATLNNLPAYHSKIVVVK